MSDPSPELPENLPPSAFPSALPKPADLGPYAPPHDFDHGEEFEPNVPRPVPAYFKAGSYARRQRGILYTLFVLGLMFIVFWPIPFVQGLSFYILPLKWLHWIGMGLIGIAALKFLAGLVTSGRYGYVKEGTPFVGRVTAIDRVAGGTTEAPQFKFVATVEFDHPETGEHVQNVFVPAEDFWGAAEIEKHTCTVSPGDYVTLVALPGKIDSTIKLYGFLGLDPEREFLLKNGKPLQGTSPFTAVMIAFLISAIIVLIMAAFDVLMFSFPVDGGWKLPVALAAGGFFVAGILGVVIRAVGQSEDKISEGGPVGAFLVGGFLGAVGAPLLMVILNARLDAGASKLEPIAIQQYWQTTHNFIIRDYEVEYRYLLGGKTEKRHIRFSQIGRLGDSNFGVVEVKPGRFGYSWISGVHPVIWMPEEDVPDVDSSLYEFTYNIATDDPNVQTPVVIRAKPVIELDDQKFAPIPPALIDQTITDMQQHVGDLKKVE